MSVDQAIVEFQGKNLANQPGQAEQGTGEVIR
jgi:hypothetical protein